MSSIESLLRKTLDDARPAFEQADRDLHEEVREASGAVENITGGLAKLCLIEEENFTGDNVYQLALMVQEDVRNICLLSLSSSGYPIRRYADRKSMEARSNGGLPGGEEAKNRAELHQLFERMASNPNSSLVILLRFITNNRDLLSPPGGEASSI